METSEATSFVVCASIAWETMSSQVRRGGIICYLNVILRAETETAYCVRHFLLISSGILRRRKAWQGEAGQVQLPPRTKCVGKACF